MFYNDAYFLLQEGVAVLVVAHSFQLGHEAGVPLHPSVEGLEGGGTLAVRTIELGQTGLGIRLHSE